MSLKNFADLLQMAHTQPEPQRLLLVFAAAELPADASVEEKRRFDRGDGGALAPILCVDKAPDDIRDFTSLVDESRNTGIEWNVLFVASLPGMGGHPPSADEAIQPMQLMVEAIKGGRIANFLAVSQDGELLQLERA
ncbi:MAG: ribonucleotide reductase subunit alpha [Hydrogenophaga sp.]|nr:ribonucleotide reductase subunit alpha [Hydrogenophaga sp.]